jgi:hypothetical protein
MLVLVDPSYKPHSMPSEKSQALFSAKFERFYELTAILLTQFDPFHICQAFLLAQFQSF